MFVKKGDKVRVIAGKDKGVEAVVLTALPKVNKVVVEGVNIIKKHQRPNNENPQGAIVEKEAPIHAIKRSSFGQKRCCWTCWLQICRRQKSSLQQKIRRSA